MNFVIRAATATDHPAILALNLASESLLSPMDATRLAQLDAEAARGAAARQGFTEVGTQWLPEGRKQVSFQLAPV